MNYIYDLLFSKYPLILPEFLRFARFQEDCRLLWLNAVREAQRLQYELDKNLSSMADLETKLFHARKLLEMENKARREAENERDLLVILKFNYILY